MALQAVIRKGAVGLCLCFDSKQTLINLSSRQRVRWSFSVLSHPRRSIALV